MLALSAMTGMAAVDISVNQVPKMLSFGIDARDYDSVAQELVMSILSDPRLTLKPDLVLALGPIEDNECVYFFDRVTFQERVQTLLQRSGKISVSFADQELGSGSAMEARANIRIREWEKQSISDEEMFTLFGEIASIDYILFGRLSSHIAHKDGKTEVTHRFNWKIGDCRTAKIKWTDEKTLVKSGRRMPKSEAPEWATQKRLDSITYTYHIGESRKDESLGIAKIATEKNARTKLIRKIGLPEQYFNDVGNMEAVPFGIHPFDWDRGKRIWMLYRYPQSRVADFKKRILLSAKLLKRFEMAKTSYVRGELATAAAEIKKIIAEYPEATMLPFTLAEAQILAGDIALAGKQFNAARTHYTLAKENGLASEANRKLTALPAPPRLWELYNRWDGRKIALLCLTSADNSTSRSKITADLFYNEYKAADFSVIDIYNSLSSAELTAFIDLKDTDAAIRQAGKAEAGILFFLLIESVHSGGKPKIITLPNGMTYEAPTMNTKARYSAIDLLSKKTLLSGTLEENNSSGMEQRIASIVIKNLLSDGLQVQ